MNAGKVILATILGFVFGIVCLLLAKSSGPVPAVMAWAIILNRTLIGFVIGISAWRIHMVIHGLLIGIFVSLPAALGAWATVAEYNVFLGTLLMGAIYGLIINVIIGLVFKEKKEATA